ncbi:unnamed protein product [Moneuplotes crassus]|uniref:Kinesin motor domain-containing protein n=1 Tax=Euplotes crassus TaxID=5936 RepID=A0AAD2D3V8_EUPCR|nr:unnamed protein product [Moneuplotes crassus]
MTLFIANEKAEEAKKEPDSPSKSLKLSIPKREDTAVLPKKVFKGTYKPQLDPVTGNHVLTDNVQISPNKTSITVKNIDNHKEIYNFDYVFTGPSESRMDKLLSKSSVVKDVIEGFDSTLIIMPHDDQITNSPAYKIANAGKNATFAIQKPNADNHDLAKVNKQKQVQLFPTQRSKLQYQTGLVYKAFRELYQRIKDLQEQEQVISLEVSAFQILDDKIIDLGMPDDAKKHNTVEVRNLDFEKYDMATYEDMKGTVYVKNCYYKDINSLEDFKYFIDKWLKTQGNAHDQTKFTHTLKSEKYEASKITNEDTKEESYFSHTIFSILVKRKITVTRLYIVSCAPYQSDLEFYEESQCPIYIGARKSNEALMKLMEICQLAKNGEDLDDHSKFPFNDCKFTNILKNVFQSDSNINFLFTLPLMEFNPNIFTVKNFSKGKSFLRQLLVLKLAQNKYPHVSSATRMRDYDKIMGILKLSALMQKSDIKDQSNISMSPSKNFDEEIDSSRFEKLMKPKKSKISNHKIEAFKRNEKTKFENIRNLLGLEMDLAQVLSQNLSPDEEDELRLHKEISERLQVYQKQHRKLSWEVEEINEKVNEQITMRDNIVSKYTNIFQSMEKKLADMELSKKQTTKMKEDEIREKAQKMKTMIKGKFQTGVDFMQTKCNSIKDIVSSSEDYIEKVRIGQIKRKEGVKIMHDEYQVKQYQEKYQHKKNLKEIRKKGEEVIKQYQEPEDKYKETPERILMKEKMKNDIQDKKSELNMFEGEILALYAILNEQTKKIKDMEVMQSRPKPKPKMELTQLSHFSSINSYHSSKNRKNSRLPQMHIPFRVTRNKLTRDNSEFLYKIIQKKKIQMSKNSNTSSTNAIELKCMLDTLNPKMSTGKLFATPSKSSSQPRLNISDRKSPGNFSAIETFTPVVSQNTGLFYTGKLSL